MFRQPVHLSDLFGLLADQIFDVLNQVVKVAEVTRKLVEVTDDFGYV